MAAGEFVGDKRHGLGVIKADKVAYWGHWSRGRREGRGVERMVGLRPFLAAALLCCLARACLNRLFAPTPPSCLLRGSYPKAHSPLPPAPHALVQKLSGLQCAVLRRSVRAVAERGTARLRDYLRARRGTAPLPAYAPATPCPVLTYAPATQCPVLRSAPASGLC
eukprot:270328-Rhodomonas_salina.8